MPPVFTPAVEPEFDNSVSTDTSRQGGSYRFFKGGHDVQFVKPKYSTEKKPLTVFRPFPCKSFRTANAFEPYRKDPGGRNFFGHWLKRLHVVKQVGTPSISYICHNPKDGVFDERMHPYGVLRNAVRYAVKKGQGKADNWVKIVRPSEVEPDAKACLQWTGMFEGGKGKGAQMSFTEEMTFLQGMLLVDDSKPTYGDGKAPLGWGDNPTCVMGLTKGPGNKLVTLCNEEKPNFRGAPDDFENRYVNGDPVNPETGRFLFVYPKGGDPRQGQYQSKPVDVDPMSQMSGGGSRRSGTGDDREEVGFDCYMAPVYQTTSASLKTPQQKAMLANKWIHWDDLYDAEGRKISEGLLWYPTYFEQAQMLAQVFPADMLVYAFYGEHNEWLTDDIRRKAANARSVQVPGITPGIGPNNAPAVNPQSAPAVPFGGDAGDVSDFDQFSGGKADEALPTPAGDLDVDLGDSPASGFAALGDATNDEAAPAPASTGFDPPPAAPLPSAPDQAAGSGILAAARAKLAAAKAAQGQQ